MLAIIESKTLNKEITGVRVLSFTLNRARIKIRLIYFYDEFFFFRRARTKQKRFDC